jgi:replicative DNA helicase
MTLEISKIILRNLQYNEDFSRRYLPFFKDEYFEQEDNLYFNTIQKYFLKYNALPTKENISIELLETRGVGDETVKATIEMAELFQTESNTPENKDWLIEKSQEYCKSKALSNALMEAVRISDSTKDNILVTGIPEMLNKALAVSFDTKLGHDYLEGFEERFAFYRQDISKIPFHLSSCNTVTDGGCERKTLNVVVAGTGIGKTIWMCDLAANYMKMGLNVVYFTMEIEEKKISKRIDANLMDINIRDIKTTPELIFLDKANRIRQNTKGRLEVKEYPTGSVNSSHFRFFIRELKQKKNFVPDVIIIDYLNICGSARTKADDPYSKGKSIAEELRALGQEHDAAVWTGVQFNRSGNLNSDADITNVAESMGVAHTADFMIALIATEDLMKQGQVMIKQLKSRYGDKDQNFKFIIGLDKPKMRFYELQNSSITYQPNSSNTVAQAKVVGNNQAQNLKPQNKGAIKF